MDCMLTAGWTGDHDVQRTRRPHSLLVPQLPNRYLGKSQEDEVLFARTMRGVMANIAHLNNERSRSTVWGDDGWKKVVVCVVVDGRKVFNPRTRAMLAALGVYQEGIAKNMVGGKAVVCFDVSFTLGAV